jgi:hypothetical protein
MTDHEPSVYFTTPIWGESSGIAATHSRSEYLGRFVQAMSPCLAVGRRVQHQRRGPDRPSSLYKRPQMGQTLPIRWLGRAARPETAWSSQDSREKNRGVGYQDSHFSAPGLGPGIYNVVAGQAGKSSASTLWNFLHQPRDSAAYSFASRSSVSDRSNLVRK